jgi:prepilin-type N-terminal cleavage/methylation domain-containing protein
MTYKKGFTLVELIVVMSIISLLSSIVLANVNGFMAKARDAARIEAIAQIQRALLIYYANHGSYPSASQSGDCSGDTSFTTALQPLVADKLIGKIQDDPLFPNDPWPQCYYYIPNTNCYTTGDPVHPYVLIFKTEATNLGYGSWDYEDKRWCIYP